MPVIRTMTLLALGCFLLVLPAPPPAYAQDAGSAAVVPVSVNGDPAARFSLVVMSDGYTAAEMPRYRAHLEKHLNVLWSIEPFRTYRNYINVYSVEIVSGESGITCDPAVREQRKTPLGAHFTGGCENPNARGILVNQDAARRYATRATPHFDQILVITNTDTYGGIGGGVATTSGGNSLGVLITPHELGHSLGRLQDEYTYLERGVPGGQYAGGEPSSVHHTLLTEAEMAAGGKKWFRWLGDESESGGKIGRFEGGQYMTRGVFRPSKHSMMISIGYYFDQVSRERMVQRISEQVSLIALSRPTDTSVGVNEVIWIETAHPNGHDLDIAWKIDGADYPAAKNMPWLAVNAINLPASATPHTVSVTVSDPTPFVRDPGIRAAALTATRQWTLGTGTTPTRATAAAFTGSTPTDRPVGGADVVYVTTTHPVDRVLDVAWRLNGAVIRTAAGKRTLDLATLDLPRGTHTLRATTSGGPPAARSQSREWTIDNTMPTVRYTLATPTSTGTSADGVPHYTVREEFTMRLEPADDQPGYVVAEFRLNGDGWHHYYGWPDAPAGTPYRFTPRGTTIKELVYGSLSREGLSPQPWEKREPGYGTHLIEIRAIDAAGNIGPVTSFRVTVQPGT